MQGQAPEHSVMATCVPRQAFTSGCSCDRKGSSYCLEPLNKGTNCGLKDGALRLNHPRKIGCLKTTELRASILTQTLEEPKGSNLLTPNQRQGRTLAKWPHGPRTQQPVQKPYSDPQQGLQQGSL